MVLVAMVQQTLAGKVLLTAQRASESTPIDFGGPGLKPSADVLRELGVFAMVLIRLEQRHLLAATALQPYRFSCLYKLSVNESILRYLLATDGACLQRASVSTFFAEPMWAPCK
jgi:hypothetical protein